MLYVKFRGDNSIQVQFFCNLKKFKLLWFEDFPSSYYHYNYNFSSLFGFLLYQKTSETSSKILHPCDKTMRIFPMYVDCSVVTCTHIYQPNSKKQNKGSCSQAFYPWEDKKSNILLDSTTSNSFGQWFILDNSGQSFVGIYNFLYIKFV